MLLKDNLLKDGNPHCRDPGRGTNIRLFYSDLQNMQMPAYMPARWTPATPIQIDFNGYFYYYFSRFWWWVCQQGSTELHYLRGS